MGEPTCLMHGNNLHGLGDSVSLGRFASESLAWDKWSNIPHKRYVEEAKSYAQPGSVAEKKAFFEAHYKKVAAQKAAAAAAAALLEQEKANVAANCHKSDVEERVSGTDHGAHDLLTGISNLDASQRIVLHPIKRPPPPVLNLKMFVNERKHDTTQDASKAIDTAAQSSAISLAEPVTEKIVVAADQKNKATLNNTKNLEDHPSVSEDSGTSQMDRPLLKSKLSTDQEVLQPKISRKPATPSFRSSSYGRKQSRIPLSPANYASMHPRKENMLTPRTKNSTAMDSIDKRRAAPRSLYTLMNSGSVKESCKSNSLPARKIESTKATPSAHSTPKRCATPAKTPSKVTNKVNKQPMATPSKVTSGVNKQPMATPSKSAIGVNKTSGTPSVKRRMETPVHPSAVGSKTPGQKWQIFSAVSKSLSAYKNKLQSPTISSPFTLRTEERAARRKQKLEEKFNEKEAQKVQLQTTTLKEKAETEFRRLRQSFCFKARPLPSFYNERETPKSPLKKTPQANIKSLTPARKPPTTISQPSSVKKSSRRLWKTSDQNPADHPLSQLARRINHENISPNMQHY